MSKGKKKNYNKPILPVKVGGIKVSPPKPPKKVKKKAWDEGALTKLLKNMPEPQLYKGRQMGVGNLYDPTKVGQWQQFQWHTTPAEPNKFFNISPEPFQQEYTIEFDKEEQIKQPTVDDWAEEWYEKQKKLG